MDHSAHMCTHTLRVSCVHTNNQIAVLGHHKTDSVCGCILVRTAGSQHVFRRMKLDCSDWSRVLIKRAYKFTSLQFPQLHNAIYSTQHGLPPAAVAMLFSTVLIKNKCSASYYSAGQKMKISPSSTETPRVCHEGRQAGNCTCTYVNNACIVTCHHPLMIRTESHTIHRLPVTLETIHNTTHSIYTTLNII